MRKLIIGVCLLMLISSCGGGKKKMDPFETLTEEIDSLTATPGHNRSDGCGRGRTNGSRYGRRKFCRLFLRILPVMKNYNCHASCSLCRIIQWEKKEHIEKEQWKHDPLFSRQDAYTVLFDKAEDMEMEKDTGLTSVKIEWIYLKKGKIKRYYFERLKGLWKLEAIDLRICREDTGKEDFFEFYERFANDSVFQLSRLHEPLKFVTADPEDEFQILETTLEAGQWFAFQPVLPRENLTNVNYGQNDTCISNTKVIEMKGFGNGFNNTLYFERRHGLWKLMQFEDLSD